MEDRSNPFALELAPYGIRPNTLAPAMIEVSLPGGLLPMLRQQNVPQKG